MYVTDINTEFTLWMKFLNREVPIIDKIDGSYYAHYTLCNEVLHAYNGHVSNDEVGTIMFESEADFLIFKLKYS